MPALPVAAPVACSAVCMCPLQMALKSTQHLQKHMSDFVREKRHLLAEFTVTGLLVEVMKAVV